MVGSIARKVLTVVALTFISLILLNGVLFYLNIKERDKKASLTNTNRQVEAEKDGTFAKLDSLEQEYGRTK